MFLVPFQTDRRMNGEEMKDCRRMERSTKERRERWIVKRMEEGIAGWTYGQTQLSEKRQGNKI